METGTESEVAKILVVQDLDVRIREIERELKDIPSRKGEEENRLATHKADASGAEFNLKSRQAAIKDLELEVASRQEKIKKFRQQQMDLKTNKEFQAVDTEIKLVESEIAGLEERELELMAALDEANQQLSETKKALAEEITVVQRDVSVWEERSARLEQEVSGLRERRKHAAAQVTETARLKLYERVFTRKDRALVPIESGVCGGCHMQLPPYVMHDLKKQAAVVTCNYCGRLLYGV